MDIGDMIFSERHSESEEIAVSEGDLVDDTHQPLQGATSGSTDNSDNPNNDLATQSN